MADVAERAAARSSGWPVLAAALVPPPLPEDAMPRARLARCLDRALECDLTVVTGPPGSGKTVMVAQWLAGRPATAAAWLSVGPEDDEPVQFWRHLLGALGATAPALSKRGLKRLDGGRSAFGLEDVVLILNDLAELDHDVVIVLDDLHQLSEPAVLDFLAFFVENVPAHVHVVGCAREDPPLPLHRLRVRGRLLEIGEPLLRFDHAEAEEFLRVRGFAEETERRAIEDRAEGWIAGLRLATLHPAGSGLRSAAGQAVADEAAEYLRRELILRQSDDVREFLAVTSLLDVFCSSLCDAVTGRHDADEMLRLLERVNLFLVPVGEDGWYRYHHLFRDLLRAQLTSTKSVAANDVHLGAGEWYEHAHRFGRAAEHYLAAGELERTHDLLYRHAASPSDCNDPEAVRSWIDAMPDEFLSGDTDHMVRTAAILLATGDFHEARRWLELAQEKVDRGEEAPSDARLAAAWCWYHEKRGDAVEAAAAGRQAIALTEGNLEGDDVLAQVPALLVLAHGVLGNFGAARAAFVRLPSMVHISEVRRGAMGRAALAWVAYQEGQLRGALDLAESALALDETEALTVGFARLARGAVLAERAEHASAELDLEAAIETAERLRHPILAALSRGELASLWCSAGRVEDALDLVRSARRVSPPFTIPAHVSARLRLIQAQVLFALGDVDRAATTGLAQTGPAQRLWQARVDLASGNHQSALARLDVAGSGARTLRDALEVAVVRAAVLLDAGRPEAPEALIRAAGLAEPEGFVELFLSQGGDFVGAIRRVVASSPSPYLYFLLSLHEDRRERPAPDLPVLVEPMSGRERIVLRYLQGRLSNVEIARELSISTNTLKTHLKSIYRKLGATSRAEAIAQARRLHLL